MIIENAIRSELITNHQSRNGEALTQDLASPPLVLRKGISYFSEVIPDFWLEVLEKDTPMMFAVMRSFGSLAAVLYFRIGKLCKERQDIQDLRLLRSTTSCILNESKRDEEGGKYYELKFLVLILDFFNYNISLGRRDHQSKVKVDLLIRIFPSFRELR